MLNKLSSTRYKSYFKILLTTLLLFLQNTARVIKISTNELFTGSRNGSIYGGSQLYIRADGIDATNFNNKVLVGDYECEIINYFTTATQLVCIIPKGDYPETMNVPIRVIVNNVDLLCNSYCYFNFRRVYSPYVRAIVPNTVVAGEKIQFVGYYYSSNTSDFNDVRIGDSVCDMSLHEKSFYRHGREEYINCDVGEDMEPGLYDLKIRSIYYTGFARITSAASSYTYGATPESFDVKIHPKITGISSNIGFTTGQIVEIDGKGFGSKKDDVIITLEGFNLDILDVSNDKIKIQIKENLSTELNKLFKGGAGLEHIHNNNYNKSLDDYKKDPLYPLTADSVKTIKLTLESFPFKSYYVQRYSGLFYAPTSGEYHFKTSSDDQSILQLSTDPVDFTIPYDEKTMMENLCTINGWTSFRKFFLYPTQLCSKTLEAGKYYYILAMQREGGGGDSLSLTVKIPNTDEKKPNKSPKITKIQITNVPIFEELSVKLWKATGGKFKLTFISLNDKDEIIYNKVVSDIPYDASSTDMRNLVRAKIGGNFEVSRAVLDNTGTRMAGYVDSDGGYEWIFKFTSPRSHYVIPTLNGNDLFGSKQSKIERLIEASAQITGTFSLKITENNDGVKKEETTLPIVFNISDYSLAELIMKTELGKNGVNIQRTGDYTTGYIWYIIWDSFIESSTLSYNIDIVDNLIKGGATDVNPTVVSSIVEAASNDLFYYQIPSELLSTFHDKAQIIVNVNGLKAACSKFNCDYSLYPAANIPTVDTWSITEENLSLNLLAGYDTLADASLLIMGNLSVTFGGTECTVGSVSLPNITCTLPKNTDDTAIIPAGDHKPIVHLKNRGFLNINLDAKKYNLEISSIFPAPVNPETKTLGSLGGGTDIVINGKGFSPDAVITLDGNPCEVASITNIEIKLKTPPGTAGVKEIKIVQGSLSATSQGFKYDVTKTPTITSLSRSTASPVLKSDLTITGQYFGTVKDDLKVELISQSTDPKLKSDYFCNVISVTGNDILCRLGGGFSGDYKIRITRAVYGYSIAGTTDSDKFTYGIYIDSVGPVTGSKEGGSILTITGENFSTRENENQILIGDNQDFCVVIPEGAKSNELICRTNKPKIALTGVQKVTILGRIVEEAKCRGTCNFEFTDGQTPVVSSVSPLTGVNGTSVTITGLNLDSTENVVISLKGLNVNHDILSGNITTKTATEIVFNFPILESGDYLIYVRIPGKGGATMPINRTFVNEFSLISTSPTTGYYGGQNLQINGNGFVETDMVYVGNSECIEKVFVSNKLITCRMQKMNNSSNPYVIKVKREELEKLCTDCTYLTLATSAQVQSLNSNIFTAGNLVITIDVNEEARIDMANTSIKLVSRTNSAIVYTTSSSGVNGDLDVTAAFSNVPAGNYRLDYYISTANKGYARPNNDDARYIKVNLPDSANFSMVDVQSSFAGGKVGTLVGTGFIPDINNEDHSLKVCGIPAKILTSTYNQLTFEVPMLLSETSNTDFNMVKATKLEPVEITQANGKYPERINDGDFDSYYYSNSNDCWFQLDFGVNHKAHIEIISFFPRLGIDEKYLENALIRGSNDGSTFTNLITLKENIIENWNEYQPPNVGDWKYRYIRFEGRKCLVSEFKVIGFKYIDETVNTASHKCNVDYQFDGNNINLIEKVEYRKDKTPVITSLDPKMGTTAGKTTITFTGTNLSTITEIKIDNKVCTLGTLTALSTQCETIARNEFILPSLNIKTSDGFAVTGDKKYLYIDKWSEDATWGGETPPRDGESVFVPKGQSLLIDVSTPKLKAVIVEGNLLFEDKKTLTFDAHYVFIKGGSFNVGSPENPHLNKLTITLHGKKSDISLPGFGNKLIGVMTGSIDIHGKPRTKTWCLLKETANAGSNTIKVDSTVDWQIGEEIILAPTSTSRAEFDIRIIEGITTDGTITLDKSLSYTHFAQTLRYNSIDYEVRGEVGLLTRNVLIQGNPESAEDKYGAHIMIRGNSDNVRGRFSYIELFNVGQAFQMGRYPIHFHMIGNVIGSYLEGNSIHQSYNRGTTIHGVHYLKITKSVYYDHMGHGIFWEDSIESNNLVEDNLVMGTKKSTSLLKSDLTPAAYWITRPNNFLRRNHAVGSQSFGFWYDLPNNPTGPSATSNICPSGDEFGVFENNVSHSNGIGLRVYPQYKPRTFPCKGLKNYNKLNILEDNLPIHAYFRNNLLFSNGQGFFSREPGSIVLFNTTFISNSVGIGYKEPQYEIEEYMPRLENSIMVSNSPLSTTHGTQTSLAISTGQTDGFLYKNVKFIDFTDQTFIKTCPKCDPSNSGGTKGMTHTIFEKITFENCTWKEFIHWNHPDRGRDVVYDKDGSLNAGLGVTGTGGFVTPYSDHLNVSDCVKEEPGAICSHACLKCPKNIKLRRLDIYSPNNLRGQKLMIYNTNLYGEITDNNMQSNTNFGILNYISISGFRGWAIPLITSQKYNFHFGKGVDWSDLNLYNNVMWESIDDLDIKFNITQSRELYDVFYTGFDETNYLINKLEKTLTVDVTSTEKFGQFYYDNQNRKMTMKVTGGRRGTVRLKGIYCRETCPKDPDDIPDENRFRYWNKASDWTSGAIPVEGENVVIEAGWKMILDVNPAKIKNLEILGSLFADETRAKTVITAKNIWIRSTGELHIGSQEKPFDKEFEIVLEGAKDSPDITLSPLITPSNKSLIVAGIMKVYSKTTNIQFTRLKKNALIGDKTIEVELTVDWKVGNRLILASTSQNHKEVEYIDITAINGQIISFATPLQYNHFGSPSPISTSQGMLDMRGEVALVSRDVVIRGTDEDNWGCRILIPGYTQDDGKVINGKIYLEGVLIDKCGQRDTEHAALDFNRLTDTTEFNVITKCSIRDSAGWAINLRSSTHVKIEKNVIANSLKYGVYLKNAKEIQFKDNILIKIRERTWYENEIEFDLIIGFFYDDEDDMAINKIVIHKNIISSAVWFAWAVPGLQCGTTNNIFTYNVGHSSRAGWFGTRINSGCQQYSLFTAYRNFEEGFVNRYMIMNLHVKNFILSDNNNSIAINGGSERNQHKPKSTIKDTLVLGKSMVNCDFCYNNKLDCDTNGVYTSLFENVSFELTFNKYKLPLHNSTFSNYLWGGIQELENVAFENFQTKDGCTDDKTFAIRTNNFVQDTSVYFKMKNIQTKNIERKNMFFFSNHTRLMHPAFCAKRDCTGIYNLLIDDLEGAFHPEKKRQQFFGYNRQIAKEGNCTFIKEWNGHECEAVYQPLTILKTVSNARSPVISPIFTNVYEEPADVPASDRFLSTVDNEWEFPIILKKNAKQHIQFSQSLQDKNIYRIDGDNGDYAVFRVQANDPATLVTVVNKRDQVPIIAEENKEIDWSQYKNKCGAHVFYPSNSTIFWVVTANNCEVTIKKLKTVKIAMRLDVDLADFYNDIGTTTFLDKIAGLLSIHPSQLKIVGIRKGSTIIDFVITTQDESNGVEGADSNKENEELNGYKDALMSKIADGTAELGAPILNVEANVVIPVDADDGFENLCRFYSFGNYTAVVSSSDENLAKSEKLEFVDVSCKDCNFKESCVHYLSNVCKTNSTFIGESECEKHLNPDDESGNNPDDANKPDDNSNVKEDDKEYENTLRISFIIFALLNLFN